MKDAFNPEEETEQDWDLELAEDVKSECEDKYGKVLDIYVAKESQVSFPLYLAFEKCEERVMTDNSLSLLWLVLFFSGRDLYSV